MIQTWGRKLYDRIMAAPVRPLDVVLGEECAYLLLALLQCALIVGVGVGLFGVRWGKPWGAGPPACGDRGPSSRLRELRQGRALGSPPRTGAAGRTRSLVVNRRPRRCSRCAWGRGGTGRSAGCVTASR